MAHLYIVPDLDIASATQGAELTVEGDEARHAVTVARLRSGERILLGDGCGVRVECVVTHVEKSAFTVRVLSEEHKAQSSPRFVLVQALAKGDRAERAVEAATECGVDEIIPWQAERSVSRWTQGPKAIKGQQKWQRIAHEAAKQAVRFYEPVVQPVMSTPELCRLFDNASTAALLLDPRADATLSELVASEVPEEKQTVLVLVGPEGGISPDELESLTAAGSLPVRLGPTVLRTSTAGVAALTILQSCWGSWRERVKPSNGSTESSR